MESRARAGQRVGQMGKKKDGNGQYKTEGGDEWCVRERRAGRGKGGQGSARQGEAGKGMVLSGTK